MPTTVIFSLLLLLLACAGPRFAPRSGPEAGPAPSSRSSAKSDVPAPPDSRTDAAPGSKPEAEELKDLLFRIESAYKQGEYDKGLALVKEVLQMKRTDLSSFDRIGSTYFVLGRYGEALTVWERGLSEEKDAKKRKDLAASVALARASLGLEAPAVRPAPASTQTARAEDDPRAAPPAGPSAAGTARAENDPRAAPPAKPAKSKAPPDPAESLRLYDKGVEHYARGEFLQAASLFMRSLELDQDNAKARKALERLKLKPAAP